MSWIGSIIGILVIGLIIGALGRLVAPGKQRISTLMTLGVGVAAALVGTFIAGIFGLADTPGINWWEHIIQVALAVVGVTWAARSFARR